MRFLAVLLLGLATSASARAETNIYVSVAGEKRIAVYKMEGDGKLTHRSNITTAGEPAALTTDPRRRFLFASMRSTGELSSFRIDPKTGGLTAINTVPAGADPAH